MIKLTIIKTNPEWIEATWSDEESVVWCESYSGHKEHIAMLRAKCDELGTELSKEDKVIIDEIAESFVYPEPPSQEELINTLKHMVSEYINTECKKYDYDSIDECSNFKYIPEWDMEATTLLNWNGQVWSMYYAVVAKPFSVVEVAMQKIIDACPCPEITYEKSK